MRKSPGRISRFSSAAALDNTSYTPVGEDERSFHERLRLGRTPVHARRRQSDRLTFAVSLARAARNPALEELFYFGPHPGNFAFEVGNPDLEPEHALGFDVVDAVAARARVRRGRPTSGTTSATSSSGVRSSSKSSKIA